MYLELRYRTFHAFHDIPADLQATLGRKRFAKSLDTSDKETAKARAAILEAQWRTAIERARGTSPAYLENQAAWYKAALKRASPAEREVIMGQLTDQAMDTAERSGFSMGEPEIEKTAEYDAGLKLILMATGELVKLDAHLSEYLGTLRCEAKTIDMQRSTITKFCVDFPYVADVQRKPVQQWVNRQAAAGKAAATIRRSLSELRGYWTYLISIQEAPEESTPFDKLSVAAGSNGKVDKRRPFTAADVLRLLSEARTREDATLVDLIEIARWSGARIEELCALKVDKVGKGYFEVIDAKTDAGWRQVPIHSKLQPTITRLVKRSKDGYVLPGLRPNKYGDRANAIGKRFGLLKRALGFGKDQVFHSIRKTVATLLEDAGVPENVAADIIGHEKPTMTYGLYSGGTSLKTKRAAIEKLSYR